MLRSRTRSARFNQRVLRLLGGLLIALLVTTTFLVATFAVAVLSGHLRALPILSDSMKPTFAKGDIVLVTPMPTKAVHRGDVILTAAPDSPTQPVAHRVISVMPGAVPSIQTKGDANSAVDAWTTRINSTQVWRIRFHIQHAGAVLDFARSTHLQIFATLIVVPAFVYWSLMRVWNSSGLQRTRLSGRRRRRLVGVWIVVLSLFSGPAAWAWTSAASNTATYTTDNITASYPTGLSCTWTTGTTATLNWTANGDTRLDGYDVVYSTTSGGSTTSVQTVAGRTSTSSTAFTPNSNVNNYFAVSGKKSNWRSTPSAAVPVVTCPRYLNAAAGSGTSGFAGNTGPAPDGQLASPSGTAVDSAGNLYIADTANNRIRKVDTAGIISTVAGTGAVGSANGNATSAATFSAPTGVAVDSSNNLYIADSANNKIRKLVGTTVSTIAGTGTSGFADGAATATAQFATPTGVAVDSSGNVYIADSANNRIRMLSGTTVSTVAGTGSAGFADGAATSTAQLSAPYSVAVDPSGNVYVADTANNRVRKLSSGSVSTIAGGSSAGSTGDGATATAALLSGPKGVAVDSAANVYVADTANSRVRVISGNGNIYLTGGSTSGNTGDAGLATSAKLGAPQGVSVNNTTGDVYISDLTNNRVRALQRSAVSATYSVLSRTTPAAGTTTCDDSSAGEFGMQFSSSVAGKVTGVKYYKSSAAGGTRTGHLWNASGTLIGTILFTSEPASGWETATFASPISIAANTKYTVSVYASTACYAYTSGLHSTAITNGWLTSYADGTPNKNGAYAYGGSSAYPTTSYNATSYMADVQFQPN